MRSGVNFSFARIISGQVTEVLLYAAMRPRIVAKLLRTLAGTL
jgi:hypothetical protein